MAQLPSQSSFGDYADWPGRDVLDSGGERLGGVREIYLDRETGRPEWVLVDVDGAEARFVPLADASVESSTIRIAHPASTVLNAPGIGTEPRIDQSEERRLYAHYGLGYSEDDSGSGLPDDGPPPQVDEPRQERPATDAPAAFRAPDEEPTRETAAPTGWGQTGEAAPPAAVEAPAGAAEPVPPWRLSETADRAGDETPTSSWSGIQEASNDAPPPAEPPSTEELEAADIPEPPAATDAADVDRDATPALEAPAETPALEPPAETPALEAPSADAPPVELAPAPPEVPPTLDVRATDAPPIEPTPPEAADASGPDAVRDVALGAALGAAAGPPPVFSGAPETPPTPPPSSTQPPPWTPPQSGPPAGGVLARLKSRKNGIALAAVAVVLVMIIRRLR